MATGDTELDTISWKGVDPEISKAAIEEGLVPAAFICKKLKISRRTLGRAVKSGEIEVARQIGKVRLFDPEDVDDATLEESLKNPDQKGFLIEYLLEAVTNANEHIDKLVTISHKPAQDTITALVAENTALRDRADKQWVTMAEVHDLYATALKETLMMEVEAAKDRAQTKMKEDSFALLRDKVVPMVIEEMTARRLMTNLSDIEIEAFIVSGAASGENLVILQRELAKRRKAQQSATTTEEKDRDNNGEAHTDESPKGSGPDSS